MANISSHSMINQPPLSSGELRQLIQEKLDHVAETYLPKELYEPITYTLSLGGKRIRPWMVLLGCDLFGGDIQKAVRPAVAIELFHNFTLLHDDIMDRAPIRRGRETVYKKWNENTAILSGDTLFALALEYLSEVEPGLLPSVLKLFTNTAREVCEGQQYDMNFETTAGVSIRDYLEMIRLKTAVLLGCSLKMGAILAKAPVEAAEKLYSFGQNLGISFQLQDDLLDTFGDVSFGKEIGGDISSNKKTFLFIHSLETADHKTREILEKWYSKVPDDSAEKIQQVKSIFSSLKAAEKTTEQINIYFEKALKDLEEINVPAEKKKDLIKLAHSLLNRKS